MKPKSKPLGKKEKKVLQGIINKLSYYRNTNPTFSNLTMLELSEYLKLSLKKLKTILKSIIINDYIYDGYYDSVTICLNWNKIPEDNIVYKI